MWPFKKKTPPEKTPDLSIKQEISDQIGDYKMYALCKLFCKKITNDPLVGYYFKTFDDESINNLAFKQTKFLNYLFGCSRKYTGKNMYQAHDKLYITQTEFDTVAKHFNDAMVQLEIDPELISKIMALLEKTRDEIVGH